MFENIYDEWELAGLIGILLIFIGLLSLLFSSELFVHFAPYEEIETIQMNPMLKIYWFLKLIFYYFIFLFFIYLTSFFYSKSLIISILMITTHYLLIISSIIALTFYLFKVVKYDPYYLSKDQLIRFQKRVSEQILTKTIKLQSTKKKSSPKKENIYPPIKIKPLISV